MNSILELFDYNKKSIKKINKRIRKGALGARGMMLVKGKSNIPFCHKNKTNKYGISDSLPSTLVAQQ
jgi:hypothetical protein